MERSAKTGGSEMSVLAHGRRRQIGVSGGRKRFSLREVKNGFRSEGLSDAGDGPSTRVRSRV